MKRINTQDLLRRFNRAFSRPTSANITPPKVIKGDLLEIHAEQILPIRQAEITGQRVKLLKNNSQHIFKSAKVLGQQDIKVVSKQTDDNETIKVKRDRHTLHSQQDQESVRNKYIQQSPPKDENKGSQQKLFNMVSKPQLSRHNSQELQLKSYLANVRKGKSPSQVNLLLQTQQGMEMSSQNSTMVFPGNIPNSTKHKNKQSIDQIQDKTQNIKNNTTQEDFKFILQRTAQVLQNYKRQVLEARSMIGFKNKQIEFLQAQIQTYEKRFGRLSP